MFRDAGAIRLTTGWSGPVAPAAQPDRWMVEEMPHAESIQEC